jgi:uncharacterized membrane protein YjdF
MMQKGELREQRFHTGTVELKAFTGAEKVYIVFYGEVSPHLHIHLTTRYAGTPTDYLRWNIEDWPGAPRGNLDEIATFCQSVSSALAHNSQ